jgi:hypothetical protein
MASGTAGANSDIDLMVIGEIGLRKVSALLSDAPPRTMFRGQNDIKPPMWHNEFALFLLPIQRNPDRLLGPIRQLLDIVYREAKASLGNKFIYESHIHICLRIEYGSFAESNTYCNVLHMIKITDNPLRSLA